MAGLWKDHGANWADGSSRYVLKRVEFDCQFGDNSQQCGVNVAKVRLFREGSDDMSRKPAGTMKQHTRECWVLFADREPVGVFTNHRTAIVERLRFSKEQDMLEPPSPDHAQLTFSLSKAITLLED